MQLRYFAKVRETIGLDGEEIARDASLFTVSDCVDALVARGDPYAAVLADRSRLRFALDQQMVPADAPLGSAAELAIFPPVTGG